MTQEPTYTPPPQEPKGPWGLLEPKVVFALAVTLLCLGCGVYALVTLLWPQHKETAQQKAARQTAQQYEQTAPANPRDIAEFQKQTERQAADLANSANLAKILHQGLNPNSAGANPLAVPGNPMNTDPVVYRQWVDADASARQAALSAPGGLYAQPAPSNPTASAAGANAGGVDQAREEAKKRKQQSLSSSLMAIDFTGKSSTAKAEPVDTAPAIVPAVNSSTLPDTSAIPEEPKLLKSHLCTDLCEGDHIDGVLVNRLDGSQDGYVDVMTTTPVFSHDWDPKGRRLLIPVGSRVLGNVAAVHGQQQQRLFVAFHKLRRPDGSTFSLDQFTGLDQAGSAGLRDLVNHHYLSTFGVSLALAAIGAVTQVGNVSAYGGYGGYDFGVQMRNGISTEMGQQARQVFQQKLNQLPGMTIREGRTLVKVYISQDFRMDEYLPKKELAYAK